MNERGTEEGARKRRKRVRQKRMERCEEKGKYVNEG